MCAVGSDSDQVDLQKLESEESDLEVSPASYEIFTYPADFTLEVLVNKWNQGEIIVPKFQRQYVWNQVQASRLVESFLLGLPVPPIFLYQQKEDNKFLVIDGQQRLTSISYFFEGYFGEETKGKRLSFRLSGLNKQSQVANKTYDDLNEADQRKLNTAVLRSFVIKQLNPQDDTSIYHIFSRLNTGGTLLKGQEIRNCVYHGEFNDLLNDLNEMDEWRKVIGKAKADRNKKDVELVLRFFALRHALPSYKKPMTDFLSRFMAQIRRTATPGQLAQWKAAFAATMTAVVDSLGEKPFHVWSGLNIAVFDSVCPAFAKNLDSIPADIKERFHKLTNDKDYADWCRVRTTDDEIVENRSARAEKMLFG